MADEPQAAITAVDDHAEATTPTQPAPPLEQRPAFELAQGTLWAVTVAYRTTSEGPHQGIEFWVVTASPTGEEVYPIAMAKLRADVPHAVDAFVVSTARRGDVIGTVVRRCAAS